MKHKAIQLLKTETQPVALFNGLLSVLINSNGNPNLIRNYNTRGYTPQGLETLRYDVMQHLGITAADMLSADKDLASENKELKMVNDQLLDENEELLEQLNNPLENILREMNDEEKEGFKISTQYPFLRDENCPNEFKILINDAISAYHRFKENHEELFKLSQETEENTEKLNAIFYQKASELLKDFEINREIHEELEHYAKTGEILGNHKIFGDLKLEREVEAMSAEDLAKAKNNLKANISKKKKALENADTDERKASLEQQITYLEKKRDLVDARLKEK